MALFQYISDAKCLSQQDLKAANQANFLGILGPTVHLPLQSAPLGYANDRKLESNNPWFSQRHRTKSNRLTAKYDSVNCHF